MEIIIKSSNVRQEKTRKDNIMIKQQAAIELGRDFPMVFELTVQSPYPPGRYHIAPESFRVNQYGGLELSPYDLTLVPVK